MRIPSRSAAVALAVSCALGGARVRSARAEEPPAPPARAAAGALALATDRVVVFKDGYGLFVKTGRGTADADGRVSTEEVPDRAVLGCFWAASADGRRVLGMRAEWTETREERDRVTSCVTTLELLRANVGRAVTLGLVREGAPNVIGTIAEVLDLPVPAEDPGSAPLRPRGPVGVERRPLVPTGGSLVVVQERSGARVALPVAEVRTVSAPDLVTSMRRREEVVTRAKRLSLDLGRDAAGKPAVVRLLYFAEGVRWIPSYRVFGGLEKDADVALQGEVLNEAEDLRDAALDLVVGVPSFRWKEVTSPLTLEAALRGTLGQQERQLLAQMSSNSFSNREADVFVGSGAAAGSIEMAPDLAAEAAQDLFVYGVGKVSLRRGARATYPLWQAVASARHLYTMDVEVRRDARSGEHSYRSAKAASLPAPDRTGGPTGTVWHEIELENATKVPWTTGAALLMKGDVPLGQNLLGYTPVGGRTLLPVTVAVDVKGRYVEREVERRADALQWSGKTFSLVRKEGTVTVASYRKEPTPLRVTVAVGGKAEAPSDGGRVVLNDLRSEDWPGGAHSVNNHSDVTWELTLAPGETKTLTYGLSFYVP